MKTSHRLLFLLLLLAAIPFLRGWSPTTLTVRKDDGVLRVAAPNLRFLEGKTLRRLQDGAGLVFSLQLSLSTDQFRTISRRQLDRYVVSFDLWEEKFAVVRLGGARQQASHLSKEATERWMFDHTGLPAQGLSPDSAHWVRAELRADDPRDAGGFLLDPTVTLTRLVEWFGRAQRGEAERWNLEHGPFYPGQLQPGELQR
ncbi:MAG TPA: hypothetical protein VFQ91_11515 [Bryobacteraceae bacterium]|nr:hypothetical protein [Bryobacteraceae bacterium]